MEYRGDFLQGQLVWFRSSNKIAIRQFLYISFNLMFVEIWTLTFSATLYRFVRHFRIFSPKTFGFFLLNE